MNQPNGGWSYIGGCYYIPADVNGNSELTGDGGTNNEGNFTCTEIEVYLASK